MRDAAYRDRVVNATEKLYKFILLLQAPVDYLTDRYSKRKEKRLSIRRIINAQYCNSIIRHQ